MQADNIHSYINDISVYIHGFVHKNTHLRIHPTLTNTHPLASIYLNHYALWYSDLNMCTIYLILPTPHTAVSTTLDVFSQLGTIIANSVWM